MQPITAAIYVKGLDKQKIQEKVRQLNENLINDGCTLASKDQIYVDCDNSLKHLSNLVTKAPENEVMVVYVNHDLPEGERLLYRALINKLYTKGISILLAE